MINLFSPFVKRNLPRMRLRAAGLPTDARNAIIEADDRGERPVETTEKAFEERKHAV